MKWGDTLTEVETVSHFLSKCPYYKRLRERIFGKETIDLRLEQDILSCKMKYMTLKLGQYIQKAYKIRESVIDALSEHERMLKQLLKMGFIVVDEN